MENRRNRNPQGLVVLMVGWSLLTDFDAIKRAGVPILRSLNIRLRLKQQAREQGIYDIRYTILDWISVTPISPRDRIAFCLCLTNLQSSVANLKSYASGYDQHHLQVVALVQPSFPVISNCGYAKRLKDENPSLQACCAPAARGRLGFRFPLHLNNHLHRSYF